MAIRFQCASCAQPIEIDDEWASRLVACPFCHKTTLAPPTSTLPELSAIPTASPISAAERSGMVVPGVGALSIPTPTNRAAVAAIILAGLQILCLVGMQFIFASHRLEFEEFQKTFEQKSLPEVLEAQNRYVAAQGGVPRWMVATQLMGLLMLGGWVGALVCGIIGVRRAARRGMAVTALLISSVVAMVICAGFVQLATAFG
jgi:hypothetical protein